MITEVIIPVMDQTGGEFTLAKWLKREGDAVRVGDVLCEIETSKASVEIPAEVNGVLRQILVLAGTAIPSLTVIALIADASEPLPTIDPFYRVKPPPPPTPPPSRILSGAERSRRTTSERSRVEVIVSPRARKLAAEHDIDLSTLTGTGPGGRIVEEDVRRAIQRR